LRRTLKPLIFARASINWKRRIALAAIPLSSRLRLLLRIRLDWSREFDEPIPLPDGGELRTLLDVAHYVDALPRSMHEREEWLSVRSAEPMCSQLRCLLISPFKRTPAALVAGDDWPG
jgi:hypothetical protein